MVDTVTVVVGGAPSDTISPVPPTLEDVLAAAAAAVIAAGSHERDAQAQADRAQALADAIQAIFVAVANGPVASVNGRTGIVSGVQDTIFKGVANGYAGLDSDGYVPIAQLPALYQGEWDASANDPTIPAASALNRGQYYVVGTAGTTTVSGVSSWAVGDWLVSNGTSWDKIDNTEALTLPGSSTDEAVVLWDGATGRAIKDSAILIGTAANNLLRLNASGKIPAVDGSLLTNLTIPRARVARTSNTMLGVADRGKFIDVTSGTFTQTIDAAATLGADWWVIHRNSGTGDVTIDPNESETISGVTSYIEYPQECRLILCDGAGFHTQILHPFRKAMTASGTFYDPPGYQRIEGLLWAGGGSGRKDSSTTAFAYGGGGGACIPIEYIPSAGTSHIVVIGAGGAAQTTNATNGNGGGNSSFDSFTSYGGPAGGTTTPSGGTGFYPSSANVVFTGASGAAANAAYYGGAAAGIAANRAPTVYGGGAGSSLDSSNVVWSEGLTVYGGPGGDLPNNTAAGVDGTAPGGGGSASRGNSGAGARGELRIWGVV